MSCVAGYSYTGHMFRRASPAQAEVLLLLQQLSHLSSYGYTGGNV
jgi:hypothetical protein